MKNRAISFFASIPALLWGCVIYSFSDTPAAESTDESITVTQMLLNFVSRFIYVDPAKQEMMITAIEPHIRKIAHMAEFGILLLLLLIPVSLFSKKLSVRAGFSLGVTFLYAVFDEIHQLFVPGRSGQPGDVLIDTLGALAALCLFCIFSKCFFRKKEIH